ncbi:bifunctional 3-phenylpropionate/cinnamic acid dioxygenase ferredoxin subunit [Zafaria sp. Z1313]|uniref:bifunctional 3-phenylpropionate/cinnamic acid dioxygenase ferredoxin subunit n=1 Tax=unclassified Zafaria TaxID=2828765 RepID=UPI002E79A8A5|nr:bifunctional 3-phenylpropionate/cinnamic acid dioxygenase ferredoxin subunit [Zafaria sp. J156]MEE1620969.1 bifunctional 3-phenylpropionate/cinnamic acid dioxygenase ferredoxin subunit [Zafaria sp. J156]
MAEPMNVGSVDEIPEGEAIVIEGQDNPTGNDIAVFHTESGDFYALDDECTHETASLAEGWIEDDCVECPVHAAKFSFADGAALCLPATTGVRTHKVEVVDGRVLLYPGTPAG